jgi:hypothetical protein
LWAVWVEFFRILGDKAEEFSLGKDWPICPVFTVSIAWFITSFEVIMALLSFIMLFLLALLGYSIGAVVAAPGKRTSPQILDLIIILLMWVGAFLTRQSLGKWLAVFTWLVGGMLVGFLIAKLRANERYPVDHFEHTENESSWRRRAWQRWSHFSTKIGDYQSRVLLAYLYFTFVLPFALLYRIFEDPLRLRKIPTRTGWEEWETPSESLDDARRQF